MVFVRSGRLATMLGRSWATGEQGLGEEMIGTLFPFSFPVFQANSVLCRLSNWNVPTAV